MPNLIENDPLRKPPSGLMPLPPTAPPPMGALPMSPHGQVEQTFDNPEGPKEAFHRWYIEHPNIKTTQMPRWWLEDKAAKHLEAYPTWRKLSADPNFAQTDYYRYKVGELVDAAITPTTSEQVQEGLETYAPPVLGAAGSLAGPLGTAGGMGVGSLAPQLRPLITGAPAPPVMETLNDAAINMTLGVVGDVGTQRLLLNPLASALRRGAVPFADEPGRQLGVQALESVGAVPSITQRGGGAAMQFAEAVSEGSLFGRGFAEARQRTVEQGIEDLSLATLRALRPITRADDEMGLRWVASSKNLEQFYRAAGNRRYEVVDRLTNGGAVVDTSPAVNATSTGPVTDLVFSKFVVPERKELGTGALLQKGFEGLGGNPQAPPGFLEMMHNLGPFGTNFRFAQQARSALLDVKRGFEGSIDPIEVGARRMAGEIANSLDRQMTYAAQQYEKGQLLNFRQKGMTGQQARLAVEPFAKNYQEAKEFWNEHVVKKFLNSTYRGLLDDMKTSPGKFVRFASGADTVDQLKIIRQTAPREWENVRGQIISNIVEKTVTAKGAGIGERVDVLLSKGLVQRVEGAKLVGEFKRLGPEYTNYLLGHTGTIAMQRLGAALDRAAERPTGTGKVVIALTQGGPALALLGVPWVMSGFERTPSAGEWFGAGAMIMTPAVLSYTLSKPAFLHLLEQGVIGGPKSSAFAKLQAFTAARLMQESMAENRKMEELRKSIEQPNLSHPIGPALQQGAPPPLPPPVVPPQGSPPQFRKLPPVGTPY